jgi:hypothetical protein
MGDNKGARNRASRRPRLGAAAAPERRELGVELLEARLLLSTTWFVDDSVARSGDGTCAATAFSTIGRGLRAARDGDIVMIEPGEYRENLFIDKPIRLVGSGADCTTLTARAGAAAITIDFDAPENVFTCLAESVAIDGLTIAEGPSSDARPVEIADGSSNITIGHCVLEAADYADAALAADGHVSELTFFCNTVHYGHVGLDLSGDGEESEAIVITENVFCASPRAADSGAVGVRITGADGVIISENTFRAPRHDPDESNATCAVAADDVSNVSFCHNVICGIDADSACYGLDLHHAGGTATITCNEFHNLLIGVRIADTEEGPPCATVLLGRVTEGNYFFNNQVAVCVPTGGPEIDSLCIAGNTFRQNAACVEIGSADTPLGTPTAVALVYVHDNDFGDTNTVAMRSWELDGDTDRLCPQCNWFGSYSGAIHPANPAGTGTILDGQFQMDAAALPAEVRGDLCVRMDESLCTMPPVLVPGDCGVMPVVLCNEGDLAIAGFVQVEVFLCAGSALDDTTDICIGSRKIFVSLGAACREVVSVSVHIGQCTPATFVLAARITPAPEMINASLDNDVDLGCLPICVEWSCGHLRGRHTNAVLTITNPDTGNPVFFRLIGPGTVTVDADLNVTVADSARNTILIITTTGRDGLDVNNVTFVGALGQLRAPLVDVNGTLSVTAGPAQLIWVDELTGSADIFGRVGLLRAAQVSGGGTITVDTIGQLQVTGRRGLDGDFGANLVANNFAQRRVAVGSAFIADNASGGSISASAGSVNFVFVRGWMNNFGIFAAENIYAVFAGAMMNSVILAGSNAAHTALAESATAWIGRVFVTGRSDSTGVSFANTIIGAASVFFARLPNIAPNNGLSTPPLGVDLTPETPNDFGVFVTDRIGRVLASLPHERFKVIRVPSDTPVFEPDFFVRDIHPD